MLSVISLTKQPEIVATHLMLDAPLCMTVLKRGTQIFLFLVPILPNPFAISAAYSVKGFDACAEIIIMGMVKCGKSVTGI